ncbi:putative transferase, protein kinase RLK-Pelle-LRR-Xa family [Dioscorea sansibarensis]
MAEDSDVRCLRSVNNALTSPSSRLPWNFANSSSGFVCSFSGVFCWNDQQNRVISLSLPSMSLSGSLPSDLRFCTSLQTLDLSSNSISGALPPSLCDWLPYLVTLDLSSNQLSGPLPAELSNCRFLNALILNDNSFSGPIPASIARLDRLKRLDLSDNQLSGAIPPSLPVSDPSSFANNPSLCGHPLRSCNRSLTRASLIIIIASGVFGAAASLLLAFVIWRWCSKKHLAGGSGEDGLRWADRLRSSQHRLTEVSLFHKPIVKVKLADLMAATNGFHPNHIVTAGSSRIGTAYKAVLRDGSGLTVKRLHGCDLHEKPFRTEMNRLGQLRHPNLVPLLGFCVVEDERLLVYKNMPHGSISDLQFEPDWPTRLKIGVGAARGIAWLHHGFQTPYIHQSISFNAVLLDEEYGARLTDIGILRLLTKTSEAGEPGYIAPEWAISTTVPLVATTKSDVYAFGVVLLELVTGQKAMEISECDYNGEVFKGNLVDWVCLLSASGRVGDVVDVCIRGKGYDNEIMEFLAVARHCVAARPQDRPSMYKVYESLKAIEGADEEDELDEFPLSFGKDAV